MPDKYGVAQDPYCYAGSDVLVNLLGITDQATLDAAEVEFTRYRVEHYVPDFEAVNFQTLKNIHHYLFQDLYSWAGQVRTVDISKGTTRFANIRFIEAEAAKLFIQLEQESFLSRYPLPRFVERLAYFYSELNVIHPFRDGNGRVLRLLFEELTINAGYKISWHGIERDQWLRANQRAYQGSLDALVDLLTPAVTE